MDLENLKKGIKTHLWQLISVILLLAVLITAFLLYFVAPPDYSTLTGRLQSMDYASVISEGERRLTFRSDDIALIGLLATAYVGEAARTNDASWQNKAVVFIKDALKKYPNDAVLHLQLGYYYSMFDADVLAQRYYERATILDPQNAKTWSALGTVYEERRQYSRAKALYDKALALDSEDIVANVAEVRWLFRVNNPANARVKALGLIARTEDMMAKAVLYEILGLDAALNKQNAKAVSYFDSALKISPNRVVSLASYADAVYEESLIGSKNIVLDNLNIAEAYGLRAIAIEPYYSYAYAVLSRVAKRQGDLAKSKMYAEQVLSSLVKDDISTPEQKESLKKSFTTGTSAITNITVTSIKKLDAPEGVKPGITIKQK